MFQCCSFKLSTEEAPICYRFLNDYNESNKKKVAQCPSLSTSKIGGSVKQQLERVWVFQLCQVTTLAGIALLIENGDQRGSSTT